MIRVVALSLSVLLAVGGCSVARPQTPVAAPAVTTAPPVQRGLVLPTWERRGYQDPETDDALRAITAVGAGWVQIVPTWYQAVRTSSEIGPTDSTVDDDGIRHVVSLARKHGLKVLLKPHIDVVDGTDRAFIRPADRDAWFRSYRQFINHYARLATELAAEQFAVGTELATLSNDRQRWLTVVTDVRSAYRGRLVYAANHDEYSTVAFWDAVDLIGIDVYWSLSARPTTDPVALRRAFVERLDDLAAFAKRLDRRILFTEAGFPSQRGAATAPWNARMSQRPAQDEQAAAYQALLATFTGQPWWAGVFFWTWSVSHQHDIDPSAGLDHSVSGKVAQTVLFNWWAPRLGSRADDRAAR